MTFPSLTYWVPTPLWSLAHKAPTVSDRAPPGGLYRDSRLDLIADAFGGGTLPAVEAGADAVSVRSVQSKRYVFTNGTAL